MKRIAYEFGDINYCDIKHPLSVILAVEDALFCNRGDKSIYLVEFVEDLKSSSITKYNLGDHTKLVPYVLLETKAAGSEVLKFMCMDSEFNETNFKNKIHQAACHINPFRYRVFGKYCKVINYSAEELAYNLINCNVDTVFNLYCDGGWIYEYKSVG